MTVTPIKYNSIIHPPHHDPQKYNSEQFMGMLRFGRQFSFECIVVTENLNFVDLID